MRKMALGLSLALGALLGLSAPAGAVTGSQRFFIFGQDEGGTVVATGPISGVGTDIERPDETGTFVFPQGTVNIDHPQTGGLEDFNEVTCIGRFTFSGTYDITSGSGAYAQANGEGTYTGRGIFIGRRTAQGCAEEGGTVYFFVDAEGTTTLP